MRSVIPAVKALIAKQLMEEEGMKQEKVAELLGITQSAVSKYSRNVRGHAIDIDGVKEIQPFIRAMVIVLLDNAGQSPRMLQLFCQACVAIRKTGLMCTFCERSDPKIKTEECRFCLSLPSKENKGLV